MTTLKKYYQGETFRQKVDVTNVDDNATDPNTITISIKDSAGVTKVTAATMTKDSIGVYHYDYDIPDDGATGEWTTEVKAEKTQKAIEQDRFLVLEAI